MNKTVSLGEECGNYDNIVLQEAKNTHKYGKMFYLKDRIYLIQRNPSTSYNEWTSAKGEQQLRLGLTADLKTELDNIEKAVISKMPDLVFKTHENGSLYLKFGKTCEKSVESHGELQYVIEIYGFFVQNSTGCTYFQMDLMEQQSTKVSFLNKPTALNYVPNSKTWDDSAKF